MVFLAGKERAKGSLLGDDIESDRLTLSVITFQQFFAGTPCGEN